MPEINEVTNLALNLCDGDKTKALRLIRQAERQLYTPPCRQYGERDVKTFRAMQKGEHTSPAMIRVRTKLRGRSARSALESLQARGLVRYVGDDCWVLCD